MVFKWSCHLMVSIQYPGYIDKLCKGHQNICFFKMVCHLMVSVQYPGYLQTVRRTSGPQILASGFAQCAVWD
jgi:hypothetical protein